MKLRRLLSCILALLLASSLPLTAFAETYDLEKGSISVTANAEGQYVSQEANDIKNHLETTTTVITQTILLQKKNQAAARALAAETMAPAATSPLAAMRL